MIPIKSSNTITDTNANSTISDATSSDFKRCIRGARTRPDISFWRHLAINLPHPHRKKSNSISIGFPGATQLLEILEDLERSLNRRNALADLLNLLFL